MCVCLFGVFGPQNIGKLIAAEAINMRLIVMRVLINMRLIFNFQRFEYTFKHRRLNNICIFTWLFTIEKYLQCPLCLSCTYKSVLKRVIMQCHDNIAIITLTLGIYLTLPRPSTACRAWRLRCLSARSQVHFRSSLWLPLRLQRQRGQVAVAATEGRRWRCLLR